MKKLFALFGLILLGITNSMPPISAKAETIPLPANYLNLSASETSVVWIPNVYRDHKNDKDEKYQIVFFDANSKYEIESIEHINYSMKHEGYEKRRDGQVNSDKFTNLEYKTDRRSGVIPGVNPQYRTSEYEYQSGQFVETKPREEKRLSGVYFAFFAEIYNIRIPQVGKTTVLKKAEQLLGSFGFGLSNKLLFEFYENKVGFDSVTSFFNKYAKYEYYLIIPESDPSVKLDYISVKAYDIHGNLITNEVGDITPVPDVQDTFSFNIVKQEGSIVQAGTAIHFPDQNRFKLTGLMVSGVVKIDENKDSDIYAYGGNLIGKTTLAGVVDSITKVWKLTPSVRVSTSYLFNGSNNSLLIDIPANVSSVTITIEYYVDPDVEPGGLNEPFLYNLLDKNGNYGIRGGNGQLAPEPNLSFWGKIKDFFGFGSTKLPDLIQIFRIVVGGLIFFGVFILIGKGIRLLIVGYKFMNRKR